MKRKRNILWLDDDEVLKLIADQIFSSISDHVQSYCFFTDGYQALSYLQEADQAQRFPDLLLIDLKMPEMDGLEFLQHYRKYHEKHPDTEVYVLSSSVRSSDMVKVKKFSFIKDYVVKPLTADKLKELVEK